MPCATYWMWRLWRKRALKMFCLPYVVCIHLHTREHSTHTFLSWINTTHILHANTYHFDIHIHSCSLPLIYICCTNHCLSPLKPCRTWSWPTEIICPVSYRSCPKASGQTVGRPYYGSLSCRIPSRQMGCSTGSSLSNHHNFWWGKHWVAYLAY